MKCKKIATNFYMARFCLIAIFTPFFLSSCTDEDVLPSELYDVYVDFSFDDLNSTIDPLSLPSRATGVSATEANIKLISLMVLDKDKNEVSSVVQTRENDDFGIINMKLPIGDYTFVAVGHADTAPNAEATISSFTDATLKTVENLTLYTATRSVTVQRNGPTDLNMNMGVRKNAMFRVIITDKVPGDVQAMRFVVSPSGATTTDGVRFNPTTGIAVKEYCYQRTITLEYAGGDFRNKNLGCSFLLAANTQSLTVRIDALDENRDVLYSRTKTNIPFQQNHMTTLKGTLFSNTSSGSFVFDKDYVENEILPLD